MTLTEATRTAGNLLALFPNTKAADAFIGAMAAVLMEYPRQVALRASNPVYGVARHAEFLSITTLVAWLERQVKPLHEESDRNNRVKDQLESRDEWEKSERNPALVAKCRSWLNRTDPKASELTGEKNKEQERQEAYENLVKKYGKETIDKIPNANRDYFKNAF